ncbi:SIMPL domain-containing protein [Consotaella salsifontis]|uniref:26 kDa periplasmic immunogenic protein n=1 Tax=Consotaella salsifontis TaxID=1365950 RepID=A0A1T4PQW9_9HYPH|nr:SIMPL domain-containing protein [Consotaella salsifontis]SJZ93960.1 hypothetical protein SAMN05428963_104112 [Consotaella salsifontis]
MRIALCRTLLPLVILASAPAWAEQGMPGTAASSPRDVARISVSGTGEISVKPDMAVTTVTVLRDADTSRAAVDAVNEAAAKVISELKQLGIEARDLQTSDFSISPRYSNQVPSPDRQQNPEIIGYEARNSVTIRIRDVARIGEVLDRVVTQGVNQGGNISFVVSDPAPARADARRKAVEQARSAAETLAEAAGVKLGRILSINDGGEMAPMPVAFAQRGMMKMEDASVPVEVGENTIRANVDMVFEIAE